MHGRRWPDGHETVTARDTRPGPDGSWPSKTMLANAMLSPPQAKGADGRAAGRTCGAPGSDQPAMSPIDSSFRIT